MRGASILLLLAFVGAASATHEASHETYVILQEWAPLLLVAPAPVGPGVEGVSTLHVTFDVPPCNGRLLLDLVDAPANTTATTPRGSIELFHAIEAQAFVGGSAAAAPATFSRPGYGLLVAQVPDGETTLRLVLRLGLWEEGSYRLVGWTPLGDERCMDPV